MRSVTKPGKHLQVQREPQNTRFVIPHLDYQYFSIFKLACDMNGVNEGAAVLLLLFFMSRSAATALNARIALRSKLYKRQKEGIATF